MHIVIHVGAHKTASSLIQWYLHDHVETLADIGVRHVLRTEMKRLAGWGTVVEREPQRLRSRLLEEMEAGGHVVIASHEDIMGHPFVSGHGELYPHAPRLARSLREACDGLDVRVVLYVRPIESFVESYYVQTVQQGGTATFREWFDTLDGEPFSWEPMVRGLDEAFGPDAVALGDFREIRQGQNAFLRSFLDRCQAPAPETIDYEQVRNASVSARGLEMARAVNPLTRDLREHRRTRRFIQEHFSNQHEERARPMPDEIRERLREQHHAEYERLAERARAARLPAEPERPIP